MDELNNHQFTDLLGNNLEAVASEFLCKGNFKWNVKRADVGDFFEFQKKKQKVTRTYNISGLMTNANEILVPISISVPVAYMVFSGWDDNTVCTFQCTW